MLRYRCSEPRIGTSLQPSPSPFLNIILKFVLSFYGFNQIRLNTVVFFLVSGRQKSSRQISHIRNEADKGSLDCLLINNYSIASFFNIPLFGYLDTYTAACGSSIECIYCRVADGHSTLGIPFSSDKQGLSYNMDRYYHELANSTSPFRHIGTSLCPDYSHKTNSIRISRATQ